MKLQDIRVLVPSTILTRDVCIVGSGPVGLTLAADLSGSGLSVVVLESGGRSPDAWADSLNAIESVGSPRVMDQTLVRNRGFGGTSRTWSGRIAAFDDVDFDRRDWVAGSGWPIPRGELSPYLSRTRSSLGSAVADNTDPAFVRKVLGDEMGRFDPETLVDYLWPYSRDQARPKDFMRFGPRAMRAAMPDVEAFVFATLTHIDTVPDGCRVTGLEVTGPDGQARRIVAQATVLCAGGIDNARILLASDRIVRGGVGNAHDQVGRYLMDHPRGPVGVFDAGDHDRAQCFFSSFRPHVDGNRTVLTRGVALSRTMQERGHLLNAAAWLNAQTADEDPLAALAELARGRGDVVRRARDIAWQSHRMMAAGRRLAAGRGPVRRLDRLHLECIVEQPPRADSRVTLGSGIDALGVPLSRIDWKVGEDEARTVRTLARAFCAEAARLGLPVPRLFDWVEDETAPLPLPDVAHPMGTTRMSEDPRTGVVDTDCAVHGVAGLYAAGGSVFPTAGHANPTQTALALAIRLADHLRTSLRPGVSGQQPPAAIAMPEPLPRPAVATAPLVLVTGASGKIGSALLSRLIEKGFAVRALTSRMRTGDDPRIAWVVHDLRQEDLDFRRELAGCVGVLHLGAELAHPEDMWRTNVEATRALARDAEASGCRFMGYLSSVSVYGSSRSALVDETAPTLTADRDVPAEYWGNAALRAYGRTKLAGEHAIREESQSVECVVFRPTVVVDEADVGSVLAWGTVRRAMLAYRNAHHIYVGDVAEACIWALQRALARPVPQPGVTVFNLADDTLEDPSFGGLLHEAYRQLDPKPFRRVPALPGILDWTKDYLRYRTLTPRRLLGQMRFPADRLRQAGFTPPRGMASVRAAAIAARAASARREGASPYD